MSINKQEEKIIIENHFFNRFSSIYFENSEVKSVKAEAPDFLIEINGEKVGVEVMQLFNNKIANDKFPMVEKYKFEIDIIEASCQLFNSSKNIPLNVRFSFVDEFQMPQKDIPKLAKKLSELIEKRIQNISLNNHFAFSIEEELPNQVREISGYFFPEITESIWYSGKSMFLPILKQEQIKDAITAKEEKAPADRKLADNLILLLVEGIPPYSWFDKIEKFESKNFNSRFDKIFIIRNLSNELIQIK